MSTVIPLSGRNGVRVSREGDNAYVELGGVIAGGNTKNIVANDCGKAITNEGESGSASARPKNLPAAIAGLFYDLHDINGNLIRAKAAAGETIEQDDDVSVAGGYIESTGKGWCRLICLTAGVWTAYAMKGIWEVETA